MSAIRYLAILATIVLAQPVLAASVTPVYYPGNPTCADLGLGSFEFKVDPPVPGHYAMDAYNTFSWNTADGVVFDWGSSMGIDAVISKGGDGANVYLYDPEATSDQGLFSPINASGGAAAISHISVCFDYEVNAAKTAETSFTRTYEWAIAKSVSPAAWSLFAGDAASSDYLVEVLKTGFVDSDFAVAGTIVVENRTPFTANITSVRDTLSTGEILGVNCPGGLPTTLASGASLTCTYVGALADGTDRVNTATVNTTGTVGGDVATADVDFGAADITEVNPTVTVTDTNGASWSFAESGSVSYEGHFDCESVTWNGLTGTYTHPNVATLLETGASASADVAVDCYRLAVAKDAATSLTRTFTWSIDKTASESSLLLSEGQQHLVTYDVTASAASADSDHAVTGGILVTNPNPTRDASLLSLIDVMDGGVAAAVSCPSMVVPAGGSLTCTYAADLADGAARTNVATASLQNYAFGGGQALPAGTTAFSGSAPVSFDVAAVTPIDDCVSIDDTLAGPLGALCFDTAPQTFSYSLYLGSETCGTTTVENVASFVTDDTATAGQDSWIVTIELACGDGCTLTPGYWKTHSSIGPAPYDDTWAQLPSGADTLFYDTLSYYDALWTAPQGNAWYILVHAYIAAYLNTLNGASTTTEVRDALAQAEALLLNNSPELVASLKGKRGQAERQVFIDLATLLDDYNNGFVGPGHCSE
ncbi:MAG: hypothetical protein P1V51_07095 [Deltaproteobacteria bacterium]|nr:hypothetical protein [Deltaproteobacteria bacterium]